MMVSHHWFRWWLGAIRQQAINWTNCDQDLWGYIVSPGCNELTRCFLLIDTICSHSVCINTSTPEKVAPIWHDNFRLFFLYNFFLNRQLSRIWINNSLGSWCICEVNWWHHSHFYIALLPSNCCAKCAHKLFYQWHCTYIFVPNDIHGLSFKRQLGNKPLTEPMVTKIFDAISCHQAAMS